MLHPPAAAYNDRAVFVTLLLSGDKLFAVGHIGAVGGRGWPCAATDPLPRNTWRFPGAVTASRDVYWYLCLWGGIH